MKETEIKEVWNLAAESWVDFVRKGKDSVRDEMSNPSMFELLGDINGKRILDIACGEGHNTRLVRKKGASVVGVDFSENMIKAAIEHEENELLGIEYHVSDASDLGMFKDDSSFDIVTAFMALMDIKNYQRTISEISRVLRSKGRFVFNITHPCYETRVKDGKFVNGWIYEREGGGRKPDHARYYAVDNYFQTNEEEIVPWEMERLKHPFITVAFHRTLTEYSEALKEAGFHILRMLEPKPSKEALEKYPVLKGCERIPHSIAFEAMKIA